MADDWKPKCPYLSCIGEKNITCSLCFSVENIREFNSSQETFNFTRDYCYNNFDKCNVYHEIYAKECSSTEDWIISFRQCAYCCNSSGYLGLIYNSGTTHCYCQIHKIEVENFDSSKVCEWFNKKAGTVINNIFDFFTNISQ